MRIRIITIVIVVLLPCASALGDHSILVRDVPSPIASLNLILNPRGVFYKVKGMYARESLDRPESPMVACHTFAFIYVEVWNDSAVARRFYIPPFQFYDRAGKRYDEIDLPPVFTDPLKVFDGKIVKRLQPCTKPLILRPGQLLNGFVVFDVPLDPGNSLVVPDPMTLQSSIQLTEIAAGPAPFSKCIAQPGEVLVLRDLRFRIRPVRWVPFSDAATKSAGVLLMIRIDMRNDANSSYQLVPEFSLRDSNGHAYTQREAPNNMKDWITTLGTDYLAPNAAVSCYAFFNIPSAIPDYWLRIPTDGDCTHFHVPVCKNGHLLVPKFK